MTAIVMIFEMTLDYTVVLPMTLTVAISYAVRRSVIRDSIYTRKLTLRGERVPETLRADLSGTRCAAEIMNSHFELLPAPKSLQDSSRPSADGAATFLVTGDSGKVFGVITTESATRFGQAAPPVAAGDIAQSNYAVVAPRDSLWEVIAAMRDRDADVVLVSSRNGHLSAADVQGLITRKQVIDILGSDIELFGD